MRPSWLKGKTTDQSSTKSVVNFIDRAVQRVQFSTRLPALLEFTLKTAEDMVEGKTALARWTHAAAHATHTDKSLGLHCGASLACTSRPLTVEVERVAGAGSGGHVLVVT